MLFSRHYKCRLAADLTWRGLRVLVMENELLRVAVLVDKGADVVELRYKPRDLDFLWHSPTPLYWTGAERQTLPHPEGLFADYNEGGWQEVLPNGGRQCEWQGAIFGLHGEVWALPWQCRVLEDSPERVAVELEVRCRRFPLRLTRRMSLEAGAAALFIEEELENTSAVEIPVMWGHHPSYGPPFLQPGCRIFAPSCRVVVDEAVGEASRTAPGDTFDWPIGRGRSGEAVDISLIPPREVAVDEMYYLVELAEPWYAIANPELGVGVGLAWSGEVFRCVWYWASLGGNLRWPSWGRFYVVALEPFSSWPARLTRAIDNGTQLTLGPGERMAAKLTAAAFEAAGAVSRVRPDGGIELA